MVIEGTATDNTVNTNANTINRNTPYMKNNNRQYVKEDRVINHMYQLSSKDKDKVKILFREGTLRGFRLDQIPEYVWIKSKINVTYGLCKSLKEMQYWDDREWFYMLARDSVAYMGCYRAAIDRLEQLDKELWLIIMNAKVETSSRIMAVRESHAISKTSVLLMRDLPFITNLSKMYDLSEMNPENKKTMMKLKQAKHHSNSNIYGDERKILLKDKTSFNDINQSLVNNILDRTRDNSIVENILSHNKTKPVDTDVMADMQRQIRELGYDTDPEVKAHKAKIRKEIEDKYIDINLKKLDEELGRVESEDEARIIKVKQDFQKSMDYLNQIISPEHRAAISRINEITESEDDNDDSTG